MKNQNCSRSVTQVIGAGHQCQNRIKWSDGTTTDETVRGIDKEGLVRVMQQYRKRKCCNLDVDAEGLF